MQCLIRVKSLPSWQTTPLQNLVLIAQASSFNSAERQIHSQQTHTQTYTDTTDPHHLEPLAQVTRLLKVIWKQAALCHKLPTDYNGALQIRPKITPSSGPNPKPNYLPHPRTHPTYHPKPHPYPISRFATMHWTDRHTQRPTDG